MSTKLEVSMAFLFRENQRQGTNGQTEGSVAWHLMEGCIYTYHKLNILQTVTFCCRYISQFSTFNNFTFSTTTHTHVKITS